MPSKDLRLSLRLEANGKGFVGEIRVAKRELHKLTGAERRGGQEAKRYSKGQAEATQATKETGKAAATATRQTKGFGASMLGAHGAALKYLGIGSLALGVQQAGRFALRAADANLELRNRLRLVTDSEEELARVRRRLIAISRETRTGLEANAALYSRLSLATGELAISEEDRLKVVDLLNKQLKIGGDTSVSATAGLRQFIQGLASGRLAGDELRSVMENLLGVQQGLLVGFRRLFEEGRIGFEVTRANIRDLAAEGKLNAELLVDATLAAAEDTEKKFREIQAGIGESFRQLGQEIRYLFDDLEQRTGFFAGLANEFGGLVELRAGVPEGGDLAALERYLDLAEAYSLLPGPVLDAEDRVWNELVRQNEELRLDRKELERLSDQELADIVGRDSWPEQALIDLVRRVQVFPDEDLDFRDARGAAIQETARLARAEQQWRLSDGLDLSGVVPPPDLEAERAALEEELAGSSASARAFRALQSAALDGVGRAEAAFTKRIELVEKYALALDDGGAALRAWAAGELDAALAAEEEAEALRPALRAIEEQKAVYESILGPVGELTAAYGRQRAAILANRDASREEKIEAILALQVRHRQGLASREAADAEEFEAAKRRATAKAWEMLRESGVIALKELRDSNVALAAATDFSRAALERQRREAAIEAQVLRDLADASEEVRQGYRKGLRLQYDLLDQARIKADLLDQYAPWEVDQADRLRALNALYRDGALSLRQYAAAQAELAIERGEGTLRHGFESQFESMREDARSLTSDLGSNFASVFGPDGVIQRGIADSVAASLVLGDSFSENLGSVARRAVAGLVSELIRVTLIQRVIDKASGESAGAGEKKAAQAAVGQVAMQSLAAAAMAAANAYAATALIPIAGPAAAPAAAAAAFTAVLAYGAIATAAQTAAAAAVGQKFAYGGVITGRREFEHAGGRGVAGEAGPEAILPLRRGPGGQLGVGAFGGGGRGDRIEVNFSPRVAVTMASGPAGPGAGAEIGRRVAGDLEAMFRRFLSAEQRPGGLLNRTDRV